MPYKRSIEDVAVLLRHSTSTPRIRTPRQPKRVARRWATQPADPIDAVLSNRDLLFLCLRSLSMPECYRIMVVSKAWACAAREALEACALIETAKNSGGRPLAHATDLVACQAYELCGPSFVTTLPDGKPATPCTAFHSSRPCSPPDSSRPCSPPDRACCIPTGGLCVSDSYNHTVRLLSSSGEARGVLAPPDAPPSKLSSPSGLITRGDLIFVAERWGHRVCCYRVPSIGGGGEVGEGGGGEGGGGEGGEGGDAGGGGGADGGSDDDEEANDEEDAAAVPVPCSLVASVGGGEGAGAAHLSHPMGLALSGDGGRLFVADSYNHRVVCYDAALRFRYAFGDEVGGAGAVRPCPVALAGYGWRGRGMGRARAREHPRPPLRPSYHPPPLSTSTASSAGSGPPQPTARRERARGAAVPGRPRHACRRSLRRRLGTAPAPRRGPGPTSPDLARPRPRSPDLAPRPRPISPHLSPQENHRIAVFSEDGAFARSIGGGALVAGKGRGRAAGCFHEPEGGAQLRPEPYQSSPAPSPATHALGPRLGAVAVAQGRLLVAEATGCRLQVLTLLGAPLQVVELAPPGPGGCGKLAGLCVDGARALVVDFYLDKVLSIRLKAPHEGSDRHEQPEAPLYH